MHEGPTENRLGELGSLYKFYYYFYYYCLVKNAIVDLTVRLKENTKCISGNSLSLLGAQNRDNGAASQTLLTEVKLRLRRRLHVTLHGKSHIGNVKVTWAKRARSVQVSRPSNGNTCGITNKCPLFYLLLTE